MNRAHRVMAGGATILTLGIGAGYVSQEGLPFSHHSVGDVAAALARDVDPQNLAQATTICNVTPYEFGQYQGQVGPNLIKTIGTTTNASGHSEFASADPVQTSKEVANAIAPNNVAIGTAATVLSGEVGISPDKVASDSMKLAESMQQNTDVRKKTCAAVIGRMLQTPLRRMFQSPTGKIVEFKPDYKDGNLDGLTADSKVNDAEIDVFTIDAVSGSPKQALEKAIAESWGITADGRMIKVSQEEGQFRVDIHGNPVKLTTTTGTTVPGKPQKNENAQAQTGGNGTRTNNSGRGTSNSGGGQRSGTNQGNQGTGGSAGPNGTNPEAGPGGTTNSPGQGGETGGTTPGGTTPGETTGSTTPGSTSEITTPTTRPATTTTRPVTTTTHPVTTTTQGTKGTVPVCVSNPPFVIC